MNPLNRYPKAREIAYIVQWSVSGVLGLIGVVLVGLDPQDIPLWYTIAVGAASFAWTYLGVTAKNNVTGNDVNGRPVTDNKEIR